MKKTQLLPFTISHLDPLGQGVDKTGDKIHFIAGALPGEKGEAEVYRENKNLRFSNLAKCSNLTSRSPQRIDAECPHFDQCPGCQFLNVSYQSESEFKKQAFLDVLERFYKKEFPTPTFHQSDKRLRYRNRIQLHYSKKKDVIGFRSYDQSIIPVSNCQIYTPELQQEWLKLQDNWRQQAPRGPESESGIVEIYHWKNKVFTQWNKDRASKGFTQVNESMNQVLKNVFSQRIGSLVPGPIDCTLDLFGGNGNLSDELNTKRRLVFDSFVPKGEDFKTCDLYKDWKKNLKKESLPLGKQNLVIIDPPRSGWRDFAPLLEDLRPNLAVYISCSSDTFIRDVKDLPSKNWSLASLDQFDFFPSTRHFEIMAVFLRTN